DGLDDLADLLLADGALVAALFQPGDYLLSLVRLTGIVFLYDRQPDGSLDPLVSRESPPTRQTIPPAAHHSAAIAAARINYFILVLSTKRTLHGKGSSGLVAIPIYSICSSIATYILHYNSHRNNIRDSII
ncbi:hypothetical protein LCGC14_2781680, partial [marine sediment metagenome]